MTGTTMDEDAQRAFEQALDAADSAAAAFAALDALARATVGARLFTVMTVDLDAMLARRAYTSHPVEYPTSGTKPIERNDWFTRVVDGRQVFSANSLAEIAEVFPDHELIGRLGCGSVMNLPVIIDGRVYATINLLDAEGAYPPAVVERAQSVLAGPAEAALRRSL